MKPVTPPRVSWLGIVFTCAECGGTVEFEQSDLADKMRVSRPPSGSLSGEYRARADCPHCGAPKSRFTGRREE